MQKVDKELRAKALQLLTRREHSSLELQTKLQQRGYSPAAVALLISELVEHGWLSDLRFAECYVRFRYRKLFGPNKISHELRLKGINNFVFSSNPEFDWFSLAQYVRQKKFGVELVEQNSPAWRKQYMYLLGRGFTQDQAIHAMQQQLLDDNFVVELNNLL